LPPLALASGQDGPPLLPRHPRFDQRANGDAFREPVTEALVRTLLIKAEFFRRTRH